MLSKNVKNQNRGRTLARFKYRENARCYLDIVNMQLNNRWSSLVLEWCARVGVF